MTSAPSVSWLNLRAALARLLIVLGCVLAVTMVLSVSDPHATSASQSTGALQEVVHHAANADLTTADGATLEQSTPILLTCLLVALCCLVLLLTRLGAGSRRFEITRLPRAPGNLASTREQTALAPPSLLSLSISRT